MTEAFSDGSAGEVPAGIPDSVASVETGPAPGDSLDEAAGADYAQKPLSDEPGVGESTAADHATDGVIINAAEADAPTPRADDQSMPDLAGTPAAADSDLVPPGPDDEDEEDEITSGVQQASTPSAVRVDGPANTGEPDTTTAEAGDGGDGDGGPADGAADSAPQPDDAAKNSAPDSADTSGNQAPPTSVTEAARRDGEVFIQNIKPEKSDMDALSEIASRYRAETVAAMRATLVEDRQPTQEELSAVMDHVAAMREWYKTLSIMDVRFYANDPYHHLPGEEGWVKLYDDMMSEATSEPVAAAEPFAETDAATEDAEYKSLMEKADPADEDFDRIRNQLEGYRDQLAYERKTNAADAEGDDAAKAREAHLADRIRAAHNVFVAMSARRGKLVGQDAHDALMDQIGAAATAEADEPRAA